MKPGIEVVGRIPGEDEDEEKNEEEERSGREKGSIYPDNINLLRLKLFGGKIQNTTTKNVKDTSSTKRLVRILQRMLEEKLS